MRRLPLIPASAWAPRRGSGERRVGGSNRRSLASSRRRGRPSDSAAPVTAQLAAATERQQLFLAVYRGLYRRVQGCALERAPEPPRAGRCRPRWTRRRFLARSGRGSRSSGLLQHEGMPPDEGALGHAGPRGFPERGAHQDLRRDQRLRAAGATPKNSNMPTSYWILPNEVVLNQAIVRPSSGKWTRCSGDHIDWGFRSTWLYGTDYRYT